MVYDPFASMNEQAAATATAAVTAITTTISATSETGKLFGLDEALVVGIVLGILFFNFVTLQCR